VKRTGTSIVGAAVAAATALCILAAAGAATASNRTLAFKTVHRATVPWKISGPTKDAWAQVVNRVVDAPGQGSEVDFRRYFGVYAFVMRPTSGYSLTIQRVVLQRFDGGYGQICAVATIKQPSGAVEQVRSLSAHYVNIRRGRIGFNVPDHIVLRERHAAVLYATPGSRTDACRG
jgi:hypothetical protein